MKHVARKRFGQHFLADAGVIDAIVREIDPRAGQAMVEIGPGLAALTQPLVERLGSWLAHSRTLRLSVLETRLGDVIVGTRNTAPAGMTPITV